MNSTCGTSETSGVPQVRKQLASADIIEQHVEERLIVVRPDPVNNSNMDLPWLDLMEYFGR